jgi:DNA-binding ferritin-like protein
MQCLKILLAGLRSVGMVHQTNHWQAQGGHYYADHLLMDRLYKSVGSEIDALAEKMVDQFGNGSVDLADQIEFMHKTVSGLAKIDNPIKRSQAAEVMLQKLFKICYDKLKEADKLTLGMDDFLMASASNHETNTYLLGQRLKGDQ